MPLKSLVRSHVETGYHAQVAGDLPRAVAAYRQALALSPDDPEALHLLGAATLQLGHADEALKLLQRAVQHQRNNPAALANLGQAHFACGQYEQAREAFRKASRLHPQDPRLHVGTATALAMQGKFAEAETVLQRLVQRFPQEPLAWFNLGNVLRDTGRFSEALEKFERAVTLAPDMVDAHNNRAGALHALQRFEEAEREYRRCVTAAPAHLPARCNLASLLIDVGRFGEAEGLCREVIAKDPCFLVGYTLLGAALGHQGRLLDALEACRAAAALAPDDAGALMIYASASCEAGFVDEGLRAFVQCFVQGQLVPAHQVYATALLGLGRLADGWIDYGMRPARLEQTQRHEAPRFARTLPPDIAGRHVCLVREQGLGDELFFLRYASALKARGARVTYQSSGKIRTILERVPVLDHVIGEEQALPQADVTMLVGDLPHALSASSASALQNPVMAAGDVPDYEYGICVFWPPVPSPLALQPLGGRLSELQQELAQAGPPPYLGLTWRAGTTPDTQAGTWLLYKNIGIAQLADAVRDFPGTFLALQRKPAAGEIEALGAALGRTVHDCTALNEDLEGMLALLDVIDEYVGVSNTNMHLRAGLGKAARVLMPAPAEWRWTYSGFESPWFAGFSIHRQSLQGDWTDALTRLKRDLQAAHGNKGGG